MESLNPNIKSASSHFSPKAIKLKAPSSTITLTGPSYGCEHIQSLFKEHKRISVAQYTLIQQAINEPSSLIAQTHRSSKSGEECPIAALTPTYLCLQCPGVFPSVQRDKHWEEKNHAFSVESRNGYLYCQNCEDFVYDPSLEEIRSLKGRQRSRQDDYGNSEDSRFIAANANFVPCRAIGLRGLYNMGQTCFMSVVLQCLIHNPFLKLYYLAEGHKSSGCTKEACTSCALDEIITEFHSSEKAEGFGAVSMLLGSWMGAQALAGYQQQDAHEYMQFILDSLHLENGGSLEVKSADCSCVIHKLFYGKLQSTVTCDKCYNTTTTVEPIGDLSLDIRNQAKKRKADTKNSVSDLPLNIQDSLESFTHSEKLVAADYTCHNCNGTSQNATKQLSLRKLHLVLPIHLKRFEHSKSNASKLENKVKFPMQLDMFPYTSQFRVEKVDNDVPEAFIYDLSAVIVHKGKIDSGHYICYCREGKDWFMFDDSKVVLVTETEVSDANAYLLFYILRCLEE